MFSKSTTNDRTLWVHYHVPKTGGTTLNNELVDQLKVGNTLVHLDHRIAKEEGYFPGTTDELATLNPIERDEIRVITGHDIDTGTVGLFEGRPVKEIVVLRDPAARIISHYNFRSFMLKRRRQPEVSFDEWYHELGPNSMTRFLAKRLGLPPTDVAQLVSRLASFEFVGRTEDMDHWLPDLLEAMGMKPVLPPQANVTGVDHQRVLDLDDKLRERIVNENPLDYELYDGTWELCKVSYDRLKKRSETRTFFRSYVDMTDLAKKMAARRGRLVIQVAAVVLLASGFGILILADSITARAVATLTLMLVALGAIKLSLVSLVTSVRSEGRAESQVASVRSELAQEMLASPDQQAVLESTERKIDDLADRIESLAEEVRTLSRLIEPSITLIELKEQELMALREQVGQSNDGVPSRSLDHTQTDG